MKSKQFIGPFTSDIIPLNLNLPNSIKYMQIGIEHPHSIPISEDIRKIILSINGSDYAISDRDILEFEQLNVPQMKIYIKELFDPYLIIDIAYE